MSRHVLCDKCRDYAHIEVFIDTGPLYFCKLHYEESHPKLMEAGQAGKDMLIHEFTSPYAYLPPAEQSPRIIIRIEDIVDLIQREKEGPE